MTSRHLSAKIKVTRRESTLSVNYPGHMVDQPMVDVDEIVTQNHCSATLPALPAPPVNMENALQEKLQAILVTSEGLDSRFQQLQSSMSNLEDRVTQQLTNMPDELSSQLIAAQSAKVRAVPRGSPSAQAVRCRLVVILTYKRCHKRNNKMCCYSCQKVSVKYHD